MDYVKFQQLLYVVLLFLLVGGCSPVQEEQPLGEDAKNVITVSAAASLTDALAEIKDVFEGAHPQVEVVYNFGSSGSLQQQIIQGAPVDLFFSAAEDKFAELLDRGLVTEYVNVVGNQLVLITSGNHLNSIEDLHRVGTVAIGTPETVPAGMYAKEWLQAAGVWVELENQLVFAQDVRQVLTYVETGNAEAGIVFYTDALSSSAVTIVDTAEEGMHTPVKYPLGIVNGSSQREEAMLYYDFLQTEEATAILTKYGFTDLVP
ncbi:molybdate ABC transporter substrate-binding protein [Halalkalibacterium halodurans]|uniref:molybdate ABC transporter substrate-binding protein n=1 Tax=Halalkalibacterium halodurans TaxID=86665 RepID=UPI0010674208|nr:molybdate ABC transporter substrate-binding protein [Halalkalibacterium halodurans]TES53734.1 molybdate ABC transporter substrate-binding protein [Halalkalibacterium halodurans]